MAWEPASNVERKDGATGTRHVCHDSMPEHRSVVPLGYNNSNWYITLIGSFIPSVT